MYYLKLYIKSIINILELSSVQQTVMTVVISTTSIIMKWSIINTTCEKLFSYLCFLFIVVYVVDIYC